MRAAPFSPGPYSNHRRRLFHRRPIPPAQPRRGANPTADRPRDRFGDLLITAAKPQPLVTAEERSEENVAWARLTHPPNSVQRSESPNVPTHRASRADVWPSTCRSSPGQQAADRRAWWMRSRFLVRRVLLMGRPQCRRERRIRSCTDSSRRRRSPRLCQWCPRCWWRRRRSSKCCRC